MDILKKTFKLSCSKDEKLLIFCTKLGEKFMYTLLSL